MKKTILILAVAIVAVAAFGLTAFSYANAASPDVAGFQGISAPAFHQGDKEPGELAPYVDAAVADILGLTLEDLQAARDADTPMETLIENAGLTPVSFREAMEAALPGIVDQALADGVIDETQAANILERGLRGPERGFGPFNPYVLEVTADFLGMDADMLQAALQDGTTMDELLGEAGKTHLELRMAIDEATPEIVAQALTDGAIDQDLADKVLEYGLQPARCRPHRGGPGGPGGSDGFAPGTGGPGFESAPGLDG